MENPISAVTGAVKTAVNPSNFLKTLAGLVIVAVVADLLGLSGWIYQPVTSFKAWQAKKAA